MSGRIRTIKPEWLEDELMSSASDAARVLSIALLCMSDDYGRGRADRIQTAMRVFPPKSATEEQLRNSLRKYDEASRELVELDYVRFYEVRGQQYFAVRNWDKHQKVNHPGKPLVPPPAGLLATEEVQSKTYLARRGESGPIKIGFSSNPEERAIALSKTQPEKVRIIATLDGRKHEKALHRRFSHLRIDETEWFRPEEELLQYVQELSNGRAMDGQWTGKHGCNLSKEDLSPDLLPTTNDQRLGPARAREEENPPTVQQLCKKFRTNPHDATFHDPREIPELVTVATAFWQALGKNPQRLGTYGRDKGLTALCELFADDYTQAELLAAIERMKTDDWVKSLRSPDLAILTPSVVRRLLDSGTSKPVAKQEPIVRPGEIPCPDDTFFMCKAVENICKRMNAAPDKAIGRFRSIYASRTFKPDDWMSMFMTWLQQAELRVASKDAQAVQKLAEVAVGDVGALVKAIGGNG